MSRSNSVKTRALAAAVAAVKATDGVTFETVEGFQYMLVEDFVLCESMFSRLIMGVEDFTGHKR